MNFLNIHLRDIFIFSLFTCNFMNERGQDGALQYPTVLCSRQPERARRKHVVSVG